MISSVSGFFYIGIIRTSVGFSWNSAQILVGSATGGVAIAALIARLFGLDLPDFPETVIGIYEEFRYYAFAPFRWIWAGWPFWLSDLITAYLTLGFAIARGNQLSCLMSNTDYPKHSPLWLQNRFSKFQRRYFKRGRSARLKREAYFEFIYTVICWPHVIRRQLYGNKILAEHYRMEVESDAKEPLSYPNATEERRRELQKENSDHYRSELVFFRWNNVLVVFSIVSLFFFTWILLQWEVAKSLVF